jgi:hypothetical protein
MREVSFFERVDDYRDFLYEEIFREPLIRDHPFYRNLIGFVIDERSPFFYRISDPSEHFGFSGSFHFMTRREIYTTPAQETLFFLHDFTHILFPYPHLLHAPGENWHVTLANFTEIFFHQERLASNESEILAHYRVGPELREKIFPGKRLYIDVLRERGIPQLAAPDLLRMRELLCKERWLDTLLLHDESEVAWWFQRWAKLTPRWCAERYRAQIRYKLPQFDWAWLEADSYECFLRDYRPKLDQRLYERNVLQNLQIAYALLDRGDAPRSFAEAEEAVRKLEGEVFFAEAEACAA